MPDHGRFRAAAMSASASTIFVIDSAGRSFTRLADFDSLGLDPILRYGWDRRRRTSPLDDDVYSLPPDPWREQPPLPGAATTDITILQTGQGNAARELRVGAPDGFWSKPIFGEQWQHVVTGEASTGDAVHPGTDPKMPAHTKMLHGTLEGHEVTLEDFAPDCPPATLVIDGVRLPLHFLQNWEKGSTHLSGALYAEGHALPIFHGRELIEVDLQLEGEEVTLREVFRPRSLALKIDFR
jgi:hypothetical protein